jgi:aerobic carbon-monoxide dehydrogenase small subunit
MLPEEMIMKCALTVNGVAVNTDVAPRELLADLLRDRLGLTGTKVACDTAQCGSCVVHMGGMSVKSCQVLAVQAAGTAIVTIEGINDGDDLTDLQDRLWREHAVQCGFCTPGVVMSLHELLRENLTPSKADVLASLAGNLCRCTGYNSIVTAVLGLADETREAAAVQLATAAPGSAAK